MTPSSGAPEPGLCAHCEFHRSIKVRRGSTYWLCTRAADDPRYPRYLRLPVLRCRGFTPERKLPPMPAGESGGP